ncbi:Protein wings apart-like [Frankliniella fusca]|uniref:Protein wings apart-like n=1 Tax=Frankliniella fusca TaxID=407009 RepID=A0AAE1LMZ1_9NEOP|nr:Protein wings apart-like [Frankliniella fusca]
MFKFFDRTRGLCDPIHLELYAMSRHYSHKGFGRKVGNVCTTSIQFDKLFKENSNRPSAAKSAGTVGKWGITSFTSIRSSNSIGGSSTSGKRDSVVGVKRGRTDSQNSKSNDSFSFDNDSDSGVPPVIKPKKFFKSRNAEPTPLASETKSTSVASFGSNVPEDNDHPIRPMRTAASRKMMARTPSPPAPQPPSSTIADTEKETNKPPIVLRIFKGTSQLVSTTTTPTSPGNEFEVQLVEEHDLVKTTSRSKQSNSSRGKKGSKKDRSVEEEDIDETVLPVNTATSRAQRYSRRQAAAMETSETDSDPIPFIPTPKKAARYGYGRSMDKTANQSSAVDTSTSYNLYMSPEAPVTSDNPYSPQTRSVPDEPVINEEASSTSAPSVVGSSVPEEATLYTAGSSFNETELSLLQQASSIPPSVLPAAIFDGENSQPEVSDSGNVSHSSTFNQQAGEISSIGYQQYGGAPSYPTEPVHQQSEGYPLPSAYEQPSTYQPAQPPFQPYEAPSSSSSYQSEPAEPLEHMTARERFARRNRQAMESSNSASTVSSNESQRTFHTSDDRSEPQSLMDSVATSSMHCDSMEATSSSSLLSKFPSSNDDGSGEAMDVYSSLEQGANVMDSGSIAETTDPSERYSSAVVPPRKKGSIFKSRAHGSDENKKRALYKHKWCDNQGSQQGSNTAEAENSASTSSAIPSTSAYNVDDEFGPEQLTKVVKEKKEDENIETVTSIKCAKNSKGFYTVVRNVKQAHQIQESGEFQELNDDVEYILDALQEQNPIGTRCLSAITLASKCMVPAFRMHVRAHGTVAKFFKSLHDAARDQSLGLCTATVMFALSQDRLNMDLDRDSLELMLNLLESDASHLNALEDCGLSSSQLLKNKQKVRELCAEIQSQGHAKHLNLDNITVGQLAMETLLSLTSRRAGEWFKEELRELGGLEHIVRTICQCSSQIDDYVVEWTDPLLDRMRKVDRCLRVLENVTQDNEENVVYLLKYQNASLVDVLVRLLRLCGNEVPLYPVYDATDKDSTGVVLREALLAVIKVLINLSHDFKAQTYGSTLVGTKGGLLESSLQMLLHIPNYVVEDSKFDLIVLALTLLINLVEHNIGNRSRLVNTKAPAEVGSIFACHQKGAIEALILMFYQQEESARNEEAKTDAILDGKDTTEESEKEKQEKDKAKTAPQGNKTQDEQIEETVAKLLAKAGRHMEHTFVAAYIGLLIGYVIMNDQEHEGMVRRLLPEGNYKVMVTVLKKFFNFMSLTVTATGSSRGLAATETVLKYMEKLDEPPRPAEEEPRSEGDLTSDLDVSMES